MLSLGCKTLALVFEPSIPIRTVKHFLFKLTKLEHTADGKNPVLETQLHMIMNQPRILPRIQNICLFQINQSSFIHNHQDYQTV